MTMVKINKLVGNSIKIIPQSSGGGGSSTPQYTWVPANYGSTPLEYLTLIQPDGTIAKAKEIAPGQDGNESPMTQLALLNESMTEELGGRMFGTTFDMVIADGGISLSGFWPLSFWPGHWEDASGNWVQGNWSDWTYTSDSWEPGLEWLDVGGTGMMHPEPATEAGWYINGHDLLPNSSGYKNITAFGFPGDNGNGVYRTWTNTVLPPA